jgi:hypothetical protein
VRPLCQHANQDVLTLAQLTKHSLDNPIFERMKCDHDEPCPHAESVTDGSEKEIETVKLIVDPDPNRLKRSCRRVDPLPTPSRHRTSNENGQLIRGLQRLLLAGFNDCTRNPPRIPFLPKLEDEVGECFLRNISQKICRGWTLRAIHSHVERLVTPKTEASSLSIDLHRRKPKVRNGAVNRRKSARVENVFDITKISMDQLDPFGPPRQCSLCHAKSFGVAVNTEDVTGTGFEQSVSVTAGADRAVEIVSAGSWIQKRDDFGRHDRFMSEWRHALRPRHV